MKKPASDSDNNTIIDAKEAIFEKISAENRDLRHSLAEIHEIIQDNEKRQQHYNKIEDTIFAAESLGNLLENFNHDLQELFAIPIMAVALLANVWGKSGWQPTVTTDLNNQSSNHKILSTIDPKVYQTFFAEPKPLVASSLPAELATAFPDSEKKPEIASLVCVPLVAGQHHLGILFLASDDPEKFTPEKGTEFICRLGIRLAVAIENLLIRQQLETASRLDQLTGLYNRRVLNELLPLELARAKRYRLPLAVMMIDLDDFKTTNDTHGHLVGDALLTKIGKILRENTRISDTAIRYGGDEFLVIMPHTNAQQAAIVAEKILKKTARAEIQLLDGSQIGVSISIGLGTFPQSGSENEKDLLEIADQNLYQAKQSGKGRIGS